MNYRCLIFVGLQGVISLPMWVLGPPPVQIDTGVIVWVTGVKVDVWDFVGKLERGRDEME